MGKFVKYDDNERSFQTAIKTYKDVQGNEVSLVGCVHVGETQYFDEIKAYADTKEKVLFEGTGGDKRSMAQSTPDPLSQMFGNFMKDMAKNMSGGLKYQTEEIDYTSLGDNWEACDVSTQELFEKSLSIDQIIKAAQNIFDPKHMQQSMEMQKKMQSGQFSQREMMAKTLGDMDSTPLDGLFIADGRNEVVNRRIKEVFDKKEANEVSVFYGAAHMPGIEEYIKSIGFEEKEEKWVEAFKY